MDRRRFFKSGGGIVAGIAIFGPGAFAATNDRLSEVLFAVQEYYEAIKSGDTPNLDSYLLDFYLGQDKEKRKSRWMAVESYISDPSIKVLEERVCIGDNVYDSLTICRIEGPYETHLTTVYGEGDYTFYNIKEVLMPNYYFWSNGFKISASFQCNECFYISAQSIENEALNNLALFKASLKATASKEEIRRLLSDGLANEAYKEIERVLIRNAYIRWNDCSDFDLKKRMEKDAAERFFIHEATHVEQTKHGFYKYPEYIEEDAKYSELIYASNHLAALAVPFRCLEQTAPEHRRSARLIMSDFGRIIASQKGLKNTDVGVFPEFVDLSQEMAYEIALYNRRVLAKKLTE